MPRDKDGDYEVGYGKPPRHTRFVKGRSGNPRGKPPGAKNFTTLLNEALDEQEGDTVPLVIMTHTAPTGSFSTAVEEIDRLGCVTAPSLFLPVAD